jgi:lysophospholipase L1-like esterase
VGKGKIDILVSTPNPRVLCHGHPMPEGAQPGEVWECPEWNSKRNAQLVYLARKSRCDVVDHFSAWKRQVYRFAHPGANPRGLWQRMVDPIHPNALGHLVFFREMASLFDVARHFPWEEPCAQSRTTPR